MSLDFSELTTLTADLLKAPGKTVENVVKALHVSSRKIEGDWEDAWKGSATVPRGAASISYDITGSASALLSKSAISSEIGPELRGQGPLVGMLEYGTPNTGPRGYGAEALHKNEGDFVKGIELAAGDIL